MRPREFWIQPETEIYQTDRNKRHFEAATKPTWKNEIHVREVIPDDEFAKYISDLIKTRSETFDELKLVRERCERLEAQIRQMSCDHSWDYHGVCELCGLGVAPEEGV